MIKAVFSVMICWASVAHAEFLVEAEQFEAYGGWKLDTQFIDILGSPYLLAHGLGNPVEDARTTITLPEEGTYRIFVRTKDWVARWKAPGAPGKFQVLINGKALDPVFGTREAEWHWQDGGTVSLPAGESTLVLHDLTGFAGRCDALLFTRNLESMPPEDPRILPAWRRRMLGLPEKPRDQGPYDLVVVGGGYAGMGAAISGARMGCRVAFIQNRPVLGGNGSSEIRVWAQGGTRTGLFPHLGEIVEEVSDVAGLCPGPPGIYEDEKKERVVRAEKNIDLFLEHHAYAVEKQGDHITAVLAFDVRSGARKRFAGNLFADTTGHGALGAMAGADYEISETGHLGMSNLWRWQFTESPKPFPDIEWGLNLTQDEFPYPRKPSLRRGAKPDMGAGTWIWESGFDLHPIDYLEAIRDWNFRAIYGAWNAMKNHDVYERYDPSGSQHANAELVWIAYNGGNRESRRLVGDVLLTYEDVKQVRRFPDGCVPSTWSIDLHYPKPQYMKTYKDNPFISYAKFDHHVDRKNGYAVPYRCFYSRNIDNLFMGGRCASVTHEALGTTRVMKTGGMMGEVIGKAASICIKEDCLPREVYRTHWEALVTLMSIPGSSRRESVDDPVAVGVSPENPSLPRAGKGIPPKNIPGLVIDNREARLTGAWVSSTFSDGFVHVDYLHDNQANKGACRAEYEAKVPGDGVYEVRLSYREGSSRDPRVPVVIRHRDGESTVFVNQTRKPELSHGFVSLGTFPFEAGRKALVILSNEGTTGHVIADAVQFLPQGKVQGK